MALVQSSEVLIYLQSSVFNGSMPVSDHYEKLRALVQACLAALQALSACKSNPAFAGIGCTGIELVKADTINLHCFQTLSDT